MKRVELDTIDWHDAVKDSDIQAAHDYLALRLTPQRADKLVSKLKDAKLQHRRVNDLLRATDRDPADPQDRGVKWKLDRIVNRKKLTPPLVVSFDGVGADIAQGFHELSLAYHLDPFMVVPVFIAYEAG